MEKQKPEIIRDNKKRGEWAESVFAARAAENGLAVSKPSGDSETFDCVVGSARKFVAVQVKCTIARQHNAKGYICNLKCNNKKYREGSFDFLAAYAILEDTWYIVPEKAIRGMGAITLCSTMPKYEKYREAWDLLREASGCEEPTVEAVSEPEETSAGPGLARMQSAMNCFRNYLEKSGR
jgi:PD-(D/E)XK endonuclease